MSDEQMQHVKKRAESKKDFVRNARADITRKKILTAAEEAFSTLGFYGARIDEIARSANVNKRMIYEHYPSKEELYKTVLELVYRRLGECESDVVRLGSTMNPKDAIGKLTTIYFQFLRTNLNYVRMVMWENLNKAEYFREKGLNDIRDPIKRTMRLIVSRGVSMGIFREELDEQQIIMTLFACTFNYFSNIYTMSEIMRADFFADEEIAKRSQAITEMLLGYMCVSADSSNRIH